MCGFVKVMNCDHRTATSSDCRHLTASDLKKVIDSLCEIVKECKDKTVCTRALFCLPVKSIKPAVLKSRCLGNCVNFDRFLLRCSVVAFCRHNSCAAKVFFDKWIFRNFRLSTTVLISIRSFLPGVLSSLFSGHIPKIVEVVHHIVLSGNVKSPILEHESVNTIIR